MKKLLIILLLISCEKHETQVCEGGLNNGELKVYKTKEGCYYKDSDKKILIDCYFCDNNN